MGSVFHKYCPWGTVNERSSAARSVTAIWWNPRFKSKAEIQRPPLMFLNNSQMFRAARVEQDKIQSRIALLEQLKSIGSELDSSDKMVHQIIERTREVLNCDKGRLFMKDPKRNVLWSTVGGIASETSLSDGQGSIQGWVARNDQIVRIVDAYADPRFSSAEDVRTQYHTHSVIAVPMHNSQQELTGVIMMVVSAATVDLGCDCCRL